MAAKTPTEFSVRNAARYLQDNGVDVGELRMRTLARQHEIFVNDPNTQRKASDMSDAEQWHISKTALDAYIKAVKAGTARSTSSGGKSYRVKGVTQAQLVELTKWCKEQGLPEPERANKAYTPKGKVAKTSPNGAETQPSLEQLEAAEDGDEEVGSDLFEAEESEA